MRDKLILDNLGLVYKVIKDLHCEIKDEYDFNDIYGAGVIGLIKGIDTLDSTKSKSNYLYICISNSIKGLFQYRTTQKNYNGLKEISLNQPYKDMDIYLEDIIPGNDNTEEEVISKDIQIIVRKCLNKLKNTKYKTFLIEYYGIGQPQMNIREIGKKHGVSYQCVQQYIKKGEEKLKEIIEKEFKDEFR